MAVTFDGLSDAELSAMADRAWRGAARAWQEYRATVRDADAPAAAVRMMADAATSEDEYWRSIDAVVRARRNAAAQAVVNQVIADYNANKSTSISVTGHTDRAGSDAYNEKLSERRADAVREALIAGGIPAEAITTAWKGESENAVPTEDGVREQANRRAEIIIQ